MVVITGVNILVNLLPVFLEMKKGCKTAYIERQAKAQQGRQAEKDRLAFLNDKIAVVRAAYRPQPPPQQPIQQSKENKHSLESVQEEMPEKEVSASSIESPDSSASSSESSSSYEFDPKLNEAVKKQPSKTKKTKKIRRKRKPKKKKKKKQKTIGIEVTPGENLDIFEADVEKPVK